MDHSPRISFSRTTEQSAPNIMTVYQGNLLLVAVGDCAGAHVAFAIKTTAEEYEIPLPPKPEANKPFSQQFEALEQTTARQAPRCQMPARQIQSLGTETHHRQNETKYRQARRTEKRWKVQLGSFPLRHDSYPMD